MPGQQPGQPGRPGQTQPWPQPGQQDRQQFPEMQRPIFLSGKVLLEDGTPPPDSVVIERVCNGVVRPEAYTDSKGRFSFQLGQNQGVFADASVGSAADDQLGGLNRGGNDMGRFGGTGRGISERDLMGCEIRASLAGFRSEVVNLSGRRMMDNPDVGTIILKRLGNVEGYTFSAISAQAPKDARKAFDKGRDQVKKKKIPEAQKEFEKAVQIYPKYASAWYELGLVQERQNNTAEAEKSYEQAIGADPKYVNPYLNLALIRARASKWQETADITDRAIKLNPFDFPAAYFYNSVANLNLNKLDAAEKSAKEAKKLDERNRIPKINHLLGVIQAQKQDYAGAAESFKTYLALAPDAPEAENIRKQLAEIDRVLGEKAQPAQQ
jgi:tetratricopeptide (TPR) repeat protein